MIKLFVGLGNPGPEYESTRHNAGFWWIDALARELKVSLVMDKSYYGLVARTHIEGQSVAALAKFFKIAPEEVLVVHDELDVLPGQVKLKFGGSHAGHNGLRDIHAQLGSADYWRLRLGVGHPGNKGEVVGWVLKKPALDDRIAIDQCIDRSLKAIPDFIAGAMERATMHLHTQKPPRAHKPKADPPETGSALPAPVEAAMPTKL